MKPIPKFPGYQITKDGEVWSEPNHCHSKNKRLKPGLSGSYLTVSLGKQGKQCTRRIHCLVLETYVGPCPDGLECRHLDGNSVNNRLTNLCWGTRSENHYDAVRHGTCPHCKLIEEQVKLIFNTYHDGAYSQKELAEYFNVDIHSINMIINKRTWKYLWE